jgi:hypothetical protein
MDSLLAVLEAWDEVQRAHGLGLRALGNLEDASERRDLASYRATPLGPLHAVPGAMAALSAHLDGEVAARYADVEATLDVMTSLARGARATASELRVAKAAPVRESGGKSRKQRKAEEFEEAFGGRRSGGVGESGGGKVSSPSAGPASQHVPIEMLCEWADDVVREMDGEVGRCATAVMVNLGRLREGATGAEGSGVRSWIGSPSSPIRPITTTPPSRRGEDEGVSVEGVFSLRRSVLGSRPTSAGFRDPSLSSPAPSDPSPPSASPPAPRTPSFTPTGPSKPPSTLSPPAATPSVTDDVRAAIAAWKAARSTEEFVDRLRARLEDCGVVVKSRATRRREAREKRLSDEG